MIDCFHLVSILIPVYNREKIISQTIDSALSQSYQNIEVIVFDNSSTDNTWDIINGYLKKDDRVRIYRNDENLGPVLNWKKCLEKAKGKFSKILWSDDLIHPFFIEETIKLFEDQTAFVMSGFQVFDSNSNKIVYSSFFQKNKLIKSEDYLSDILFFNHRGFPVSPGCALFRTEDLKTSYVEEINNYDNLDFRKFGAGNDLLFFLLTAKKYPLINCVDKHLSYFRSHGSSITVSNDLDLYYEYAKFFFVKNYLVELLKKYRAKIGIFHLFSDKMKNLILNIDSRPDLLVKLIVFFDFCRYRVFSFIKAKVINKRSSKKKLQSGIFNNENR